MSALNLKRFLIFVSSITLIFFLFFNQKNNREKYEEFLLSQYKHIPSHTEEELKNIPKPEHPHMATFQNFFMSVDPQLGYVPSERLHEALMTTRLMQEEQVGRQVAWQNVPSNMGGRTRAIMFDPNDSTNRKVWAAGVTGGLWYNENITDEDVQWYPVNDFWDNLSVSRIVYDPQNPQTYYVATGEANTAIVTYRESSSRGVGIWKSIDAGQSWELLPSTSDFEYVTDIEIKIAGDITEIYASVVSGTYQGQEHESSPSDGLFRSIDDGQSWSQVLPNIISSSVPYSPSDIEITSSGKIFIGTMKNLSGEGGATILYSNSGDLGSWEIFDEYKNIIEQSNNNNIPGRVVLTSCEDAPEVLYGVIGSGFINNMGFNLSYGNYIIKSINAGNTWQNVNLPTENGNEWASLAWHALAVEVAPDNPETVFIGGLELYRSLNGGSSWENLSDWDGMYSGGGDRYVHADIHQIAFQPNNSNSIAVTSDGGVFFSANALDSTDPIFIERNQGYNTLQFYTCDISPENNSEHFVGGLQDNGTLLYFNDALDINDMISGGDGAFCFFDDDEPLIITSTYYNAWYFINLENNDYSYENANSGIFINPSDYDSQNNTIYANKVRFNGSQSNRIIKISNIPSDPETQTINLNTGTSVYFSAVKISPFSTSSSTTLYVGTQSGRLFRINNINNNFSTIDIGSQNFPTANISSIDFGQTEDEIFITFSNYGVPSIWMSTNGGSSWNEKEGNLPDMPVRWGLLHPDDSNFALIATEIGVWETANLLDNNTTWEPSSNGLANVRVDMLSIRESDNMVIAATHGRGLFYGVFEAEIMLDGDLNGDDSSNVLDVVIMVNYILDNEYDSFADLNQDGILNVLDIVLLVNIILN